MVGCPACGHENPEGAKFCMECAAPLAEAAAGRVIAEERKVVSVLLCDLAGFTASSESADPEDVARMLAAYFAVARARIEGHGGVVEKFIGDAVVGVFGVPAAHEDDPERAVRAGLRIVEDAEQLHGVEDAPLTLRVGVNTGEALVRLDVAPESGEGFLRGDAINTAARIQSIAPVNGVAVGLSTYQATHVVFDYMELEPATLKGKSEPVRVFHALASRARLGTDLTRTHDSPFVGREIDLALLTSLFDKTVAVNSAQLVTVVGEAGLGKSRLVAELAGYVDARPQLVTWRQGRCLPYGEGITFWALGEILKAHAGILESDPPDVATAKLETVLPEGDERPWFRQRLLPLLGIEANSTAEREELFTAWRRFLEHVADQGPTVLVFEDLHWADEAMLAFLEHLADLADGVPLLLAGTARPELYERRPDYAARLRNATPISLARLTPEETARLVSGLLEATMLPAEVQQPILDRAGGNPLYAEESVRLLRDRDLLERAGSSWQLRDGAGVPFPDSVQALITARLDTLDPDAKSLLADAAVIGKVFWAGAVIQMGDRDPQTVMTTLRGLSRKELIRPSRHSSMAGEAEYAFSHVLARDVAYNQLPRVSRASRHVAAARWIESKAADRVEDLADLLAYHYTSALDLAQAAGNADQASELQSRALRFLSLAGERALGLDTGAALANFERALALAPEEHPDRAAALARFGEAAFHAGRFPEASDMLDQAIEAFQTAGEARAAAAALVTQFAVLRRLADPRALELPARALSLLEPLPPGPEHVSALTELSAVERIHGRYEAGVAQADRALALAAQLGLERPARALGFRAANRWMRGDHGGLDDYREAIALANQSGLGLEVCVLYNNLAVALSDFEGPAAALEVLRTGIAFAEARGLAVFTNLLTNGLAGGLLGIGEHDEALALSRELEARAEADGDVTGLLTARALIVRILALRGEAAQAAEWLDWLETTSRESGAADFIVMGLVPAAMARATLGHHDRATALLTEIEATQDYTWEIDLLVRTALTSGNPQLAHRLVTGLEPHTPYDEHALTAALAALAEADGDLETAAAGHADAAERWKRFGVVPAQAFAHLGHGRCLLALGHPADATFVLQQARDLFSRLLAAPSIAECDTLLARAVEQAS
jgi:class 3 adenylate cyclase/tetratricopeptide (TPR) repeat protein